MSKESKEIYEFGPFRLDVGEHIFERSDGVKNGSLPEKAFQTLVVLVRNQGRLVTKNELLDAVWPDSIVEENNLDKAIHAVRHALGETPAEHKYIETVRKHGYRFVADVTKIGQADGDKRIAGSSQPAQPTKLHRNESGIQTIAELAEWQGREDRTEKDSETSSAIQNGGVANLLRVEPTNAYQACQLANYHFSQMTPVDMMKSHALLNEALRLDPDYAPAHSALAKQWVQEVVVGFLEPAEAYPKARASLLRALNLDWTSAEFYTVAGFVGLLSDWDFAGAEQNLRRALEINPHHAFANSCLGQAFMFQYQPDKAEPYLNLGAELDPTNFYNRHLVAISHFLARRYEDSIAECNKMLAVYPRFMIAAWIRCWSLEQTGRAAEAVAEYEKALGEPYGAVANRWIGYALAVAGDTQRAVETIAKLDGERCEHYISPTHLAAVCAAMNDADRAFDYLEEGIAQRDPWMLWIMADPRFDNLRLDSRFDKLVERVTENKETRKLRTQQSGSPTVNEIPKSRITVSGQHALVDLSDWRDVVQRLDSQNDSSAYAVEGKNEVAVDQARSDIYVDRVRNNYFRWVAPIGIIAVLAIVGVIGAKLWQGRLQGASAAISQKRLTVEGGATRVAISPDGRYAAVAQNAALILFDLKNGGERVLVPASKDIRIMTIAFHPGGASVYYGTRPVDSTLVSVYSMPLGGGEATKILEDIYGQLSFSPDGKRFAFVRRYPELNEFALLTADSNGSNINKLASSRLPNRFEGSPAWSPDGSKIVLTAISVEGGFHFTVAKVNVSTGSVEFVPDQRWTGVNSLSWLADSQRIVVAGQVEKSLHAQVWLVDANLGTVNPVTNDSFVYESISGTADGRSIVAVKVRQSSHLWMLGEQQVQLTAGFDNNDGAGGIAWASDGAIFYHSRAGGHEAIWRTNVDGNDATEITPDTVGGFDVSPDGRLLVFQAKQSAEHLGLQLRDIAGGTEQSLTRNVTATTPSFFPDGKRIAYCIYDQKVSLFEIGLAGGQPTKLTDEFRAAMSPSVSPSGKFIAFAFNRVQTGNIEAGIAVIASDSKQVVSTHRVKIATGSLYEQPTIQWSDDESELYFIQLENSVSNIMKVRISDGTISKVTNFADGRIFNFAVEPGGSRILIARGFVERDASLLQIDRPL